MRQYESSVEIQEPVRIENTEKPDGYVAVDWDIILKHKLSRKRVEAIVKDLLGHVENHKFNDRYDTSSLQYQLFKSVDFELLYNLKVFRQIQNTNGEKSLNGLMSVVPKSQVHASSPDPLPKPPAEEGDSTSTTEQVPTNPPGPTAPAPPSEAASSAVVVMSQVPTAPPGPRAPKPPTGVLLIFER